METTMTEASAETGGYTDLADLLPGQRVRVSAGFTNLGAGLVDARTDDGSMVWVDFGGAYSRRLFMAEDRARFALERD